MSSFKKKSGTTQVHAQESIPENQTGRSQVRPSLYRLFSKAADQFADATAVEFGDRFLSYRDLKQKAEDFSEHLINCGIGEGQSIGLSMERSIETIVALLSIYRCGAHCIPIDPSYPRSRVDFMLSDSRAQYLLTSKAENGQKFPATLTELKDVRKDDNQCNGTSKELLAYIIYTSGSTGLPKGVALPQKALTNLIDWQVSQPTFQQGLKTLQYASLSFDVSYQEIFATFESGGTLVLIDEATRQDPEKLLSYIDQKEIGRLFLPYVALRGLAEWAVSNNLYPDSLREIYTAGEQLVVDNILRQCFNNLPDCTLENQYGPSESHVVTTFQLAGDPSSWPTTPPIGTPIANSDIFILNKDLSPCLDGNEGEIAITGDCLAHGYFRNSALTEERFINIPKPGEAELSVRVYLSGDLGRKAEDGNIHYLGRKDHQVKIRGFRVEPGEVEARITDDESVKQAVVVVKELFPGERQLVSFVVSQPDHPVDTKELKRRLSDVLPDYMVPAFFVLKDHLPLTPSGKVDRKALQEEKLQASAASDEIEITPESTSLERTIGLWRSFIGNPNVLAEDHFIESGGHSLIAMRLVAHLRGEQYSGVSVSDLISNPTALQFSKLLEQLSKEAEREEPLPTVQNKKGIVLASIQESILLDAIKDPAQPTYNEPWLITIDEPIDHDALQIAINQLIERHEIFRTTYHIADGNLSQSLSESFDTDFTFQDLSTTQEIATEAEIEEIAVTNARLPMDLTKGEVIRFLLLKISEEQYKLQITAHHIVSDVITIVDVLVPDLFELYQAANGKSNSTLGQSQYQFHNYAVWERQLQESDTLKPSLEYWKAQLKDLPVFELPGSHPRPSKLTHSGIKYIKRFKGDTAQQLEALAKRHGETVFNVSLAAFKALMYSYTQQSDIVIGSISAGREHPDSTRMAGCFLNYLILRTELDGDPNFNEVLKRVRKTSNEAIRHQSVSYNQLVKELKPPRHNAYTPFYQVMFFMETATVSTLENWKIDQMAIDVGVSKIDLTVGLDIQGDELILFAEHNTDIYEIPYIEELLNQFHALLQSLARGVDFRLSTLPQHVLKQTGKHVFLPSLTEKETVPADFNKTEHPIEPDLCLHHRFCDHAKNNPHRIAVVFGDRQLTYEQLDRLSNGCAQRLQDLGISTDEVVAVVMERSEWLPVALFGILKAGAAFLPVDQNYPQERIQFILQDSEASAIIGSGKTNPDVVSSTPQIQIESISELDSFQPNKPITPSDLAYVIYTSGSTGKPKGALIEHRSIVNRLLWMADQYRVTDKDVQIQKTPITFDVSVHEHFLWSITGGCLVIPPVGAEKDPEILIKEIEEKRVTLIHFVPSMLDAFLEYLSAFNAASSLSSLRHVFCSGESLPIDTISLFKQLLGVPLEVSIHNLYGPTEAAVDVSYYCCDHLKDGEVVPIGRPVWNTQLYVLDNQMNPLPLEEEGELYIAGVQVGRGYLNREKLTESSFIPNPFEDKNSPTLYRTGDLARWLPNGTIEYRGRKDFQLKVRGIRIEPGEIETALKELPAVARAVVAGKKLNSEGIQLVAYVTLDANVKVLDKEALLADLKKKVPSHSIPAAVIVLDELPLNASGKLDRKQLPDPIETKSLSPNTALNDIQDPLEEVLASIWCQVLETQSLDRQSGFFELGGHSLLAVKLLGRIRASLGISLTMPAFLDVSNFEQLLAKVRKGEGKENTPETVTRRNSGNITPMTWGQRRWWFLNQMDPSGVGFNIAHGILLKGNLNTEKLISSIRSSLNYYETFRTVFKPGDGEPFQCINEIEDLKEYVSQETVELVSLEEQCDQILKEEWNRKFDLETGPLVKIRLIEFSGAIHFLTFSMHHVIADERTESILHESLSAYYNDENREDYSETSQIADYAVWERDPARKQILAEQTTWWKEQLKGAPAILNLPTDFKRPESPAYRGNRLGHTLDKESATQFSRLIRDSDATLFMGFQAAWSLFLGKLCNSFDVVIGAPISLRNRPGLENTAGFLLNSLPFRTKFKDSHTFQEILSSIRLNTLEVYRRAETPFDKIVEATQPTKSVQHSPIFQVMLVMNGKADSAIHFSGLETRVLKTVPDSAKFDLTLFVTETGDELLLEIEYNTDLFLEDTITDWLEDFSAFVSTLSSTPDKPLSNQNYLSDQNKTKQLDWAATEPLDVSPDATLLPLFLEQSKNCASRLAIKYASESISYKDLEHYSHSFATLISAEGETSYRKVGICMDRSPGLLVAILGVLRAGCAYVPIDPSWPLSRISWFLEDSGVDTLILGSGGNTEHIKTELELHPVLKSLEIIELDPTQPGKNLTNVSGKLDTKISPETIAYTIYTSGSTGQPKGVMVRHKNLLTSTLARKAVYRKTPEKFLMLSPPVFDSSVAGIFWTLSTGGTLVFPPKNAQGNPEELAQFIETENITHYLCLPSLHYNILSYLNPENASLKTVIVAGESCPSSLPAFHRERLKDVRLFNEYGPTEGTVWSTVCDITNNESNSAIPIGNPIPSTKTYVVDKNLKLIPRGATGELVIAGAGLAEGYHNQPELTKERFIENWSADQKPQRIYRTGDLVRWTATGSLEFIGRVDHQIKVRGYRIEPGEIESAFESYDAVEKVVVVAHTTKVTNHSDFLGSLDLNTLASNLPSDKVAELVAEVKSMSPDALENAASNLESIEKKADRSIVREDFKIDLTLNRKNFVDPPREAQRNWILGQAMEEFADDLEYLDKVSESFVTGKQLEVNNDFGDITNEELTHDEIMEDWQTPVMQAMAEYVTESHGDVLEIGFGRGVSAEMIQKEGVRSHTIVEVNDYSIKTHFAPWREKHANKDIRIINSLWQDAEEELGLYDGIFFHAFPLNEKEFEEYVLKSVTFAGHAFPAMARHLKPGGVFTYLTLEIDSMSRRHQRLLFDHFSSITTKVIPVNVPEDTADVWWAKSIVVIKAEK